MRASERIRNLLLCGAIAGPFYVAIGVIQILIRPGFDVTKHALSLMSNGDLGWIQIANFVITGLLLIAFAVGVRAEIRGSRAGTFGSLLFAIYGLCLIGAGIFSADPALGFPPGTPADARGISTSGCCTSCSGALDFTRSSRRVLCSRVGSPVRMNADGFGFRLRLGSCFSPRLPVLLLARHPQEQLSQSRFTLRSF